MKNKTVCLVLGLSLSAVTGCISPSYSPPDATVGAHTYASFDSEGKAIVRGWFTVIVSPSGSVSGEWHFVAVGNRQDIGPQTGDGQLTGSVVNGMLTLNLNPGWADNNVFLSAQLKNGLSGGTWEWSTFAGTTNHGAFEAKQLTFVE